MAQYIGNDDYRGYLNYLYKNNPTDYLAGELLNRVGNDAVIGNTRGLSGNDAAAIRAYNQKLMNQYTQLHSQGGGGSGSGGGGSGAPAPVYAPKLDVAAINAQARNQAAGAVNPYYTKVLNDFLTQQSYAKQQRQTQYDTDIKNLQEDLGNTLQGNEITRGRTTEDTALKEADINQQADRVQVDQGMQFEDARIAQARQAATAGTLGSGAGNRATAKLTEANNLTEERQGQDFQQSKDQAELLKGRTFEDLGRSDFLAKAGEGRSEGQQKFDLNNFIQNAIFTETNKRNELELSKQQDIDAKAKQFAQDAYNNYLRNIANPAQRVAAAQQYGSSF